MIHPRSTSAVDPGSPSVDYDRVGVDSGYASQSTSGPNTPGQHAEADSCFLKVANVQRSLFPGNRIVVKTYDISHTERVRVRYMDLVELFWAELKIYLANKGVVVTSHISFKLKAVGADHTNRVPCMVVFCGEEEVNKVRSFFRQKWVKEHCQPKDDQSDVPCLKLLICDEPPRLIASTSPTSIYRLLHPNANFNTHCGTEIRSGDGEQSRYGRLGGVVLLESEAGVKTLYGTTAGHIVESKPNDKGVLKAFLPNKPKTVEVDHAELDYDDDTDDDNDDKDDDYDNDNDDDDHFELEDADKMEDCNSAIGSDQFSLGDSEAEAQFPRSWSKIGSAVLPRTMGLEFDQNLDLGLVEIQCLEDCRPNFMFGGGHAASRPVPLSLPRCMPWDSPFSSSSTPVVLLSNQEQPQRGLLSHTPSFLLVQPGHDLTKTFPMVLENRSSKTFPLLSSF